MQNVILGVGLWLAAAGLATAADFDGSRPLVCVPTDIMSCHGAGTSKLEVRVQAYQATENGLRRIAQAEVDSHGTRMPGRAVPVAGGAIAGTVATSAVISGGMAIVKETRGAMRDDAGRIADEIAKRAEASISVRAGSEAGPALRARRIAFAGFSAPSSARRFLNSSDPRR